MVAAPTNSVYNRWEAKVYETTNYQNDWTGTSNVQSFIGRDNNLPDGTYFYVLTWMDGTPPLTGFITLKENDAEIGILFYRVFVFLWGNAQQIEF